MFELILTTIKETIIKTKLEIVSEVLRSTSRDNAEIRCDLLEIKRILKREKEEKEYASGDFISASSDKDIDSILE